MLQQRDDEPGCGPFKLSIIKMREVFDLFDSNNEAVRGFLNQNTSFHVTNANRYMFEAQHDQFEDDGDKGDKGKGDILQKYFENQSQIIVLVLTNGMSTKVFPIKKRKIGNEKRVNSFKVITNELYVRDYHRPNDCTSNVLSDIMAIYDEFDDHKDCYI